MSTARQLHYTYRDYLDIEQRTDVRHEYLEGEIYAMAGGTPEHGFLAARLIALVSAQLPLGCRIASSDVKIRIEATGLTTYPDASVICGAPMMAAVDAHAVTNPVLIMEVTSPSTEDYDRGEKLNHYKQIPSAQTILIVSHTKRQVSVIRRTATGWTQVEVGRGEQLTVEQPKLTLLVDELYAVIDGLPNAS